MIHGVLNVYKEKGYTSHDVVAKLRGIVGQKKIGHTGTLDPDAVGVLPVCLGRATRLCDMLTEKDKIYETVLLLGTETDTQDITGNIVRTGDIQEITEEEIRDVVNSFVGGYDQIPPMYSALKVNGKKLYELAREGKAVERKARRVEIYEIQISEVSLPRIHMKVHCSKGTYIRTLCHDIGQKLGCGACMEELKRTKVSSFVIGDSLTLDRIKSLRDEGKLLDYIIPIDEMFADYGRMTVKSEWARLAYNGNALPPKALKAKEPEKGLEDFMKVRMYDDKGDFIGIYEYRKNRQEYVVVKMFYLGEGN